MARVKMQVKCQLTDWSLSGDGSLLVIPVLCNILSHHLHEDLEICELNFYSTQFILSCLVVSVYIPHLHCIVSFVAILSWNQVHILGPQVLEIQ